MLENLFGPHIENVSRALSRASQRHSLLSANLANVNTPGYKRRDVDFNVALQEAIRSPRPIGALSPNIRVGGPSNGAVRTGTDSRAAQPQQGGSLRLDGNNVDMEKEVMSIAETELRYQALSDMAASYFSGLKNVIREGR